MNNKNLMTIWSVVMLFLFVTIIAVEIIVLLDDKIIDKTTVITSTKFILNLVVFQLGVITAWLFNNNNHKKK